MRKSRLDVLLVELGLTDSRARAQALILAGDVQVSGQTVTKAGALVAPGATVTVRPVRQWASRGAHKLLRALEVFPVQVSGRVCVDLGASTGGFTDVLLSNGAAHVYAVDVGYGQLLWRLASDPRVTVMDRTNARNLTFASFDIAPSLVTCDASFISLKLLLPAIESILTGDLTCATCAPRDAIVLIKPQFEAGRESVGKGGVVRDPAVHERVLREVTDFICTRTGLSVAGLTWSPILGPSGNIEFLCWLVPYDSDRQDLARLAGPVDLASLVAQAHDVL